MLCKHVYVVVRALVIYLIQTSILPNTLIEMRERSSLKILVTMSEVKVSYGPWCEGISDRAESWLYFLITYIILAGAWNRMAGITRNLDRSSSLHSLITCYNYRCLEQNGWDYEKSGQVFLVTFSNYML